VDTFFISQWPSEIQGNIFSLWLVYVVVGFARYIYTYIYIEILSFVDIENVRIPPKSSTVVKRLEHKI
jgi:hypothetical protein